ncbi:TlyA family RNA methyltransferase [Mastigocoleus sp. MO_188.B34]|uniref:TlyA family RNA methyltransferase n=1 Tax=Mastigocoleus sp. MO_188.B34 TaxID=3036635 RepID=UPI00261BE1FF|nr:TlyA family RNA methyltransferase [Mastigocoleus sp. MO_188.B34]MDJ0692985.1 TlyA family RNA methyltransferase [Mastigocoleus sp. MO_188.B34]
MTKQRLDILLVQKNLCSSRATAQRLIQAGEVFVNNLLIDKAGTEVDVAAVIKLKERSRYVSRGGEKLAKALDEFQIQVSGRVCLDGGISTGGFTDCLLKAGAKRVYGIDVGYGQVDWGLRNDSRVVLRERTNLRHLTVENLYQDLELTNLEHKNSDSKNSDSKNSDQSGTLLEIKEGYADLAVVDVSFISLTKVLPAIWLLTQPPREAVLLVKPQFEVGRNRVGKKGVVRDLDDQADAIFQVLEAARKQGWNYAGLTWSPITGPKGNIEYLLWLNVNNKKPAPDLDAIKKVTKSAFAELKKN